jgi:hypothetical protein
MDLNGYSAWISVDGTALREYNIEVSNGNSATCWIASEAGKASRSFFCFDEFHSLKPSSFNVQNFTVNWRDSNRTSRISGFVKLDGTLCGGNTVAPMGFGAPLGPVTIQKASISTSIMTEKPFLFSPLELTG